jgi:hypothetical protein
MNQETYLRHALPVAASLIESVRSVSYPDVNPIAFRLVGIDRETVQKHCAPLLTVIDEDTQDLQVDSFVAGLRHQTSDEVVAADRSWELEHNRFREGIVNGRVLILRNAVDVGRIMSLINNPNQSPISSINLNWLILPTSVLKSAATRVIARSVANFLQDAQLWWPRLTSHLHAHRPTPWPSSHSITDSDRRALGFIPAACYQFTLGGHSAHDSITLISLGRAFDFSIHKTMHARSITSVGIGNIRETTDELIAFLAGRSSRNDTDRLLAWPSVVQSDGWDYESLSQRERRAVDDIYGCISLSRRQIADVTTTSVGTPAKDAVWITSYSDDGDRLSSIVAAREQRHGSDICIIPSDPESFLHVFRNSLVQMFISTQVWGSRKRPRLSSSQLATIVIPWPSDEERKRARHTMQVYEGLCERITDWAEETIVEYDGAVDIIELDYACRKAETLLKRLEELRREDHRWPAWIRVAIQRMKNAAEPTDRLKRTSECIEVLIRTDCFVLATLSRSIAGKKQSMQKLSRMADKRRGMTLGDWITTSKDLWSEVSKHLMSSATTEDFRRFIDVLRLVARQRVYDLAFRACEIRNNLTHASVIGNELQTDSDLEELASIVCTLLRDLRYLSELEWVCPLHSIPDTNSVTRYLIQFQDYNGDVYSIYPRRLPPHDALTAVPIRHIVARVGSSCLDLYPWMLYAPDAQTKDYHVWHLDAVDKDRKRARFVSYLKAGLKRNSTAEEWDTIGEIL